MLQLPGPKRRGCDQGFSPFFKDCAVVSGSHALDCWEVVQNVILCGPSRRATMGVAPWAGTNGYAAVLALVQTASAREIFLRFASAMRSLCCLLLSAFITLVPWPRNQVKRFFIFHCQHPTAVLHYSCSHHHSPPRAGRVGAAARDSLQQMQLSGDYYYCYHPLA